MLFQNKLLAVLPAEISSRLAPRLRRVFVTSQQAFTSAESLMDAGWFIESGYVSLMTTLSDGKQAEVGLVGREGMVGYPLIACADTPVTEVRVRAPCTALRMDAAVLWSAMSEETTFRALLLNYIADVHASTMNSVACNGSHGIEQRLARWLLMAHDRAESTVISATQEDLGSILCVRRTSITLASRWLQEAGIIRYTRGRITIVDRTALEAFACECYSPLNTGRPRIPLETAVPFGSRLMKSTMPGDYRVHFLDAGRRVVAVDVFDADNDDEALRISAVITDACRDVCDVFEIWHGDEMIATERDVIFRQPPEFEKLIRTRQLNICEREEFLRDSSACIRDSRKLLATLEHLERVVWG